MSAKDTLRRKKVEIVESLCGSGRQEWVHRASSTQLITPRERDLLSSCAGAAEEQMVDLVDKILMKGEEVCRDFLELLETDATAVPAGPGGPQDAWGPPDVRPPDSKRRKQDDLYELNSDPTGLCVIINNDQFQDGSQRRGTDKDAESLAEVFTWLGFRVLVCRDQTVDQMERTLTCFASLSDLAQLQLKLEFKVKEWLDSKFTDLDRDLHHGDAFICCILSHGEQGSVLGIDRKPLPIKSITAMFKTTEESALKGKPKVFLIQACQGKAFQQGVVVDELETDDGASHSIPEQADVLIAAATVQDYEAVRHVENGSWFIQALCDQLKDCCPRGEDISRILHRVNQDVSRREAAPRPGAAKQMSEFTSRLTRTLVLSPHVK